MNALRAGLLAFLFGCGRFLGRAATLAFYAAAGTLRLEDLRRSIQRQSEESGALESDTSILSGLMGWERDFYLRFLRPGDRILVVGCGTGRDLVALLDLGYRAEGLDVGPECVARARLVLDKRGLVAPLYTGAIETVELAGSCDVVIFSWFCYAYIPRSESRIGVLRRVKGHLNPGGRILISYQVLPTVPRRLPIRLAQCVAWVTGSDWRPEFGDQISPSWRDRFFTRYEHFFQRGALEAEAQAAGLRVVFHERGEIEATAALTA